MEYGFVITTDGPVCLVATTEPGSGLQARFRIVDFDEFMAAAFEFTAHGQSHNATDNFPQALRRFTMVNQPITIEDGSTLL